MARRIRAEPHGQGMLLVALSGYALPGDATRSPEPAFDYHLVKPVDPEQLTQVIGERADASSV